MFLTHLVPGRDGVWVVIAIVTHVQTQHTLTAQPAQPLTAPHTHVPS